MKDLDNMARLILPALHEIWTPPSRLSHTFKTANINSETLPEADLLIVIAFGQKIAPHIVQWT